MAHQKYMNDAGFKKLVSTRNRIATILTIVTLIVYFGFIFLLAFGKELMATKISSEITLGLPLGVAVIIISWALTYSYAHWANQSYDHMADEIKTRLGG